MNGLWQIREIADECGVDFDDTGKFVIDHVHYNKVQGNDRTLTVADNFISSKHILPQAPVWRDCLHF